THRRAAAGAVALELPPPLLEPPRDGHVVHVPVGVDVAVEGPGLEPQRVVLERQPPLVLTQSAHRSLSLPAGGPRLSEADASLREWVSCSASSRRRTPCSTGTRWRW